MKQYDENSSLSTLSASVFTMASNDTLCMQFTTIIPVSLLALIQRTTHTEAGSETRTGVSWAKPKFSVYMQLECM